MLSTRPTHAVSSYPSISVWGMTTQAVSPDQADEAPVYPALPPSRAADFKTCPLLYRSRTIDRLPETPSPDQARGTLVHAVLERLFDLPAGERTASAAADLVEPAWATMIEDSPSLAELFSASPA